VLFLRHGGKQAVAQQHSCHLRLWRLLADIIQLSCSVH
jgi:hypothetical protein